ncbi:hypothetical protein CLV98_10280 [Dyadobacter jejuensis]|uniref:Uncharacterized protein n=1 Tax=Dyadobacter jejuensis TaxID=1082580 RepID=A0A316AP40_9BACT|nr:hypothetical protein CLV98_10280 [Dyadobacter jejuensis]
MMINLLWIKLKLKVLVMEKSQKISLDGGHHKDLL